LLAETIKALVNSGVPVMAHIGMLDQSFKLTGIYMVRGKTEEDRQSLIKDDKPVEEAGAFLVGLDGMTLEVGKEINELLKISTCEIGAGYYCDGCSLNVYDMIGLTLGFEPKFVKRYVDVRDTIAGAVRQFVREVKEGIFPDDDHSYH
jgi:3-methyl-2-oxobutanoate hydroxymethyltransferase